MSVAATATRATEQLRMAVLCRLRTVGGAVPELDSLVAIGVIESWSSRGQWQHFKDQRQGQQSDKGN